MTNNQSPPAKSLADETRDSSIFEIYFPYNRSELRNSIYVASFPDIIYLWPSIVVFLLCAFFQGVVGISPQFLGWLAVITFGFNVIVLVQDFDQRRFIVLFLAVLVGLLGIWILSLYGFSFLKTIANWILELKLEMSTDTYLALGLILSFLFTWGIITPLFSYWRLENNEFIHYSQPIGKDMSIARTGCTIYKEIPDIFEFLLTWGGGTLVIRRENQILATIPNVPFLGLRMIPIEHMLSETRVTVAHDLTQQNTTSRTEV